MAWPAYLAARIRRCAVPIIGNRRRSLGWRCGQHGRPAAGRFGRFAVVGTAGPGSGAEHERTRFAAGRPRACAADALASRRTGNRGCRVQPAQCRPGQTGRETPGCCSTRAPWRTSTRVPIPSDELTKIDQVLGQLRLGQVSAEGHASRRGEPEENDLDRVPTRRRQMQRQSPADLASGKLWFLADPKRCVSYSPSPPLAGDLGFRRRRVHPAGG